MTKKSKIVFATVLLAALLLGIPGFFSPSTMLRATAATEHLQQGRPTSSSVSPMSATLGTANCDNCQLDNFQVVVSQGEVMVLSTTCSPNSGGCSPTGSPYDSFGDKWTVAKDVQYELSRNGPIYEIAVAFTVAGQAGAVTVTSWQYSSGVNMGLTWGILPSWTVVGGVYSLVNSTFPNEWSNISEVTLPWSSYAKQSLLFIQVGPASGCSSYGQTTVISSTYCTGYVASSSTPSVGLKLSTYALTYAIGLQLYANGNFDQGCYGSAPDGSTVQLGIAGDQLGYYSGWQNITYYINFGTQTNYQEGIAAVQTAAQLWNGILQYLQMQLIQVNTKSAAQIIFYTNNVAYVGDYIHADYHCNNGLVPPITVYANLFWTQNNALCNYPTSYPWNNNSFVSCVAIMEQGFGYALGLRDFCGDYALSIMYGAGCSNSNPPQAPPTALTIAPTFQEQNFLYYMYGAATSSCAIYYPNCPWMTDGVANPAYASNSYVSYSAGDNDLYAPYCWDECNYWPDYAMKINNVPWSSGAFYTLNHKLLVYAEGGVFETYVLATVSNGYKFGLRLTNGTGYPGTLVYGLEADSPNVLMCFTTPSLQEHCFAINNSYPPNRFWAQLIWLGPNSYTRGLVAVNVFNADFNSNNYEQTNCGTTGIAYFNGCYVSQYAQFSGSQGAFGYSQYPYVLSVASWTDSIPLSPYYVVQNFIHPDW
jgi:hypothetical protein